MQRPLTHWLILPLMLALTACAGGDKFPFTPQFVNVTDVPPSALAAPPTPDSAIQKKEIAYIIAAQAKLSAAEKAQAMHEDSITPAMMVAPVLGAEYNETTHPQLFLLMRRAASDAWRIGDNTQNYWKRTRPWLSDSRVELLVKPITRPSYPSGHTVTNHVWAHVLSDLFPNKKAALFKRAYEVGSNRMLGGVHYPSDVAAGKKLAAIIYTSMHKNAEFQRAIEAARAELTSPIAANDNTPLASECTKQPMGMTMCR
jgi:acid phosphatase (class A)